MACLASHPGFCHHDLGNEIYSPRPRLVHGDFAVVPLAPSNRGHSNRSLAQHINDDNALDTRCALQHPSNFGGVGDAALIDRNGPFICSSCAPRCRSHPHLCDDHLDVPEGWQSPYTYPLQCMEPGGVRWGPDQIHAYNRDVLRHNNQIARRRDGGVPGKYLMLHPMMDPLGRFPPGFDRPLRLQDFFSMDGKQHSHLLPVRSFSMPSSLIILLTITPLLGSHPSPLFVPHTNTCSLLHRTSHR